MSRGGVSRGGVFLRSVLKISPAPPDAYAVAVMMRIIGKK
jgi:hypothetical protein